MAWRDSRASRRGLVLASAGLVFGIAALVAVGSLGANVRTSMDREARALVGADLVVTGPGPLGAAVDRHLDSLGGARASERMFASMLRFPTAGGALRLVQVRALEGDFPFYGKLGTEPADGLARFRSGGPVLLLEDTLMRQFSLRAGDPVVLGNRTFTLAGALTVMPGESAGVTLLAPRAVVPLASLAGAGLGGPGPLTRYRTMLRLPEGTDAEAVAADLKDHYGLARLSFETVAGRRRDLGRAIENVDGFLSLVGLVALLLGGIGVAGALHGYVSRKRPTVALFRCLGMSAREAMAIYLVQALGIGLCGAACGVCLGIALQQAVPRALGSVLPFDLRTPVAWAVVGRGAVAGLGACLLFAALPLLGIRRVAPLAVLRSSEAGEGPRRPDAWVTGVGAVIVGAAALFAWAQTGSLRLGLGYTAGLAAAFAVLCGLGRLAALAARHLAPKGLPYPVRQGIAGLHRPGNRTTLLIVCLGLGTFLSLTLFLARSTLLSEIRGADAGGRPNLILFDIQEDQVGPLARLAAGLGDPLSDRAPIVTMRLAAVRGRPVADLLADRRNRVGAWALRREYRSTYRSALSGTETLVAGTLTPRVGDGQAAIPVSVEEGLARDLGLQLGDVLDWDVQGVPLHTTVGSLRHVEWRRMEPNFFVVFPEGVLEDAPKTFIAALHTSGPADSARVQGAVLRGFPTVTAIDLTLVADTLDAIFAKVAVAIELMAAATALTGAGVLVSSVLASRHQRLREAALLRTLGASRLQIRGVLGSEYAVLGALAGVSGTGMAAAANVLLAHAVLKMPAVAPLPELAAAVAAAVVLTLAAGLAGSRGLADTPPLVVLRQEQ